MISDIALGNYQDAEDGTQRLITDIAGDESLAKSVYSVAKKYRNSNEYEKARDLYGYAINSWPGTKYALLSRRWRVISIAMGDYQSAMNNDPNMQSAIDRTLDKLSGNPFVADAASHLIQEYYKYALSEKKAGNVSESRKYFRTAIREWDELTRRFPDSEVNAESYYLRAQGYLYLQQPRKAIECWSRIIAKWPDSECASDGLFRMGRTWERLLKSREMSKLGAEKQIKSAYRRLVVDYPNCEWTKYARLWLSQHN